MSLPLWFYLLLFVYCEAAHQEHFAAASGGIINSFHIYHRLDEEIHLPLNKTSILSLPLDVRMQFAEFLQKQDMHSFIRSCKSNLDSCRLYIHSLISIKFAYLLNHNRSKVSIKHLLNIPLVDSITINPIAMTFYFNRTSSRYIGIDSKTGNGFISFWIKRVDIKQYHWKIITILFNKTGVDFFYLSDSSRRSSLISPMRLEPLNGNSSSYYRLKAINQIVLNGTVTETPDIFGHVAMWCLNDQWESRMFWPRMRAKFYWIFNIRTNCRSKARTAAIIFIMMLVVVFWLGSILILLQIAFHVRILY